MFVPEGKSRPGQIKHEDLVIVILSTTSVINTNKNQMIFDRDMRLCANFEV